MARTMNREDRRAALKEDALKRKTDELIAEINELMNLLPRSPATVPLCEKWAEYTRIQSVREVEHERGR